MLRCASIIPNLKESEGGSLNTQSRFGLGPRAQQAQSTELNRDLQHLKSATVRRSLRLEFVTMMAA